MVRQWSLGGQWLYNVRTERGNLLFFFQKHDDNEARFALCLSYYWQSLQARNSTACASSGVVVVDEDDATRGHVSPRSRAGSRCAIIGCACTCTSTGRGSTRADRTRMPREPETLHKHDAATRKPKRPNPVYSYYSTRVSSVVPVVNLHARRAPRCAAHSALAAFTCHARAGQ